MEGQVKCKHCHGKKVVWQYVKFVTRIKSHRVKLPCPQCEGRGTIFWIDEIMGRNKKRRKRQWKKPKGPRSRRILVRRDDQNVYYSSIQIKGNRS
mgnify:CR=1 FL=1